MDCPRCNGEISAPHTWHHTWWTPITCQRCSTKLQFERQDYFKKASPLLASSALLIMCTVFNVPNSICLAVALVVLFLSGKSLFCDLRSLNLKAKDET